MNHYEPGSPPDWLKKSGRDYTSTLIPASAKLATDSHVFVEASLLLSCCLSPELSRRPVAQMVHQRGQPDARIRD